MSFNASCRMATLRCRLIVLVLTIFHYLRFRDKWTSMENTIEKIKYDIDFYLRLAEIFSALAVGFGVITFAIYSQVDSYIQTQFGMLPFLLENQTQYQHDVLVNTSASLQNVAKASLDSAHFFIYGFELFLILTLLSLWMVIYFRNELRKIRKNESQKNNDPVTFSFPCSRNA